MQESHSFGSESSAFMECLDEQQDEQTSLMERGEDESCYSGLLGKQATQRIKKVASSSLLVTVLRHMPPSFQPAARGAGRSNRQSTVSTILRNLITCRAVNTSDSVIELGHDSIKNSCGTDLCLEICTADNLGGSTRTSGDPWNQRKHQTASFGEVRDKKNSTDNGEFTDLKSVPAANRPVRFPTCSLCGKEFKPENLHSHMKSCRGMKMLARKAVTAPSTRGKASPWRSATSSDRASNQTSLLCH